MELNKAQEILTGGGFELSDLLEKDTYSRATHTVAFLKDANGNPVLGVTIVGKNSEEASAEKNRTRIENIMRAAKREKALDTATLEGATIVSETVSGNETSKAVAVTIGWFGFNEEGSPATFTKERVAKLYAKMPHWEEMVNNALDTDANFMKV